MQSHTCTAGRVCRFARMAITRSIHGDGLISTPQRVGAWLNGLKRGLQSFSDPARGERGLGNCSPGYMASRPPPSHPAGALPFPRGRRLGRGCSARRNCGFLRGRSHTCGHGTRFVKSRRHPCHHYFRFAKSRRRSFVRLETEVSSSLGRSFAPFLVPLGLSRRLRLKRMHEAAVLYYVA